MRSPCCPYWHRKWGKIEKFGNKFRLTGFNLAYLKARHRGAFAHLKAVYRNEEATKSDQSSKEDFYPRLLAEICVSKGIEVAEIIGMFLSTGGRAEKTAQELRRKIESEITRFSTLDASELLCDENYTNQPSVNVVDVNSYCKRIKQDIRQIGESASECAQVYGRGERIAKLATELACMEDWLP